MYVYNYLQSYYFSNFFYTMYTIQVFTFLLNFSKDHNDFKIIIIFIIMFHSFSMDFLTSKKLIFEFQL